MINFSLLLYEQYVEPILERLDQKGCIRYRLARNATRYQDGKHYRVSDVMGSLLYPQFSESLIYFLELQECFFSISSCKSMSFDSLTRLLA